MITKRVEQYFTINDTDGIHTGEAISTEEFSRIGYQFIATGDITTFSGTAYVEVSNDAQNWYGLISHSLSGIADIPVTDKTDLYYGYIRVYIEVDILPTQDFTINFDIHLKG
jgi:hypothetical protein